MLLDHSSDFPLPSSIILHTSSNWSLSEPLFYTSAGISSMPGALSLANVLMLVLSSSKVKALVLIGIVSCTIYLLGSCLRPQVGLRVWQNGPSIFLASLQQFRFYKTTCSWRGPSRYLINSIPCFFCLMLHCSVFNLSAFLGQIFHLFAVICSLKFLFRLF